MQYIRRDVEKEIIDLSKEYSCILLTGPRQVGKTTVFKELMGAGREYVSLDDVDERSAARNDPALFLQLHPCPVLIDEVQYAPELFSYIKMAIDNGAAPGSFWLTGSQNFRLMRLAQESLAGRTAVMNISGLSQHEMYGTGTSSPFTLDFQRLKEREKNYKCADISEIYDRIWRGSMPAFVSGRYSRWNVYYSGYLQTYLDRDLSDQIKVSDPLVFRDFIRAAACRVGQLLNIHDIASDVGVTDDTAKRWLKILERSGVIFFLRPYSNNLLKRTVKTPKMYFFDTGLVAYLARYVSPEILANGAMNGAILENYAVSEIIKSYENNAQECLLWYYRDTNSYEIDLVLESEGMLHPLEIKRAVSPDRKIVNTFRLLDKASVPRGKGAVLCMHPKLSAVDSDNYIVPIWML